MAKRSSCLKSRSTSHDAKHDGRRRSARLATSVEIIAVVPRSDGKKAAQTATRTGDNALNNAKGRKAVSVSVSVSASASQTILVVAGELHPSPTAVQQRFVGALIVARDGGQRQTTRTKKLARPWKQLRTVKTFYPAHKSIVR